jgi:uncharacterized membrane protein YfcA
VVLSLVLGSVVGLVLGVLGGGGSVLAIPALTYALGLEAKAAIATSLLVVGAAAVMAVLSHARRGHVRPRIALVFGALGALGAVGGSQLARWLPGAAQLLLFAGIMLVAGWRMLQRARQAVPAEDAAATSVRATRNFWLKVVPAALATGVLTGVVGVGGGFLIVPALVVLVGLPMRQAIGTSLAVIVLNAAGGLASYVSYVSLDLAASIPFAAGAAGASWLGSALGQRVSPRRLQAGFGALILLVAAGMIAKEGHTLLDPPTLTQTSREVSDRR